MIASNECTAFNNPHGLSEDVPEPRRLIFLVEECLPPVEGIFFQWKIPQWNHWIQP